MDQRNTVLIKQQKTSRSGLSARKRNLDSVMSSRMQLKPQTHRVRLPLGGDSSADRICRMRVAAAGRRVQANDGNQPKTCIPVQALRERHQFTNVRKPIYRCTTSEQHAHCPLGGIAVLPKSITRPRVNALSISKFPRPHPAGHQISIVWRHIGARPQHSICHQRAFTSRSLQYVQNGI